MQPCSQPRDGLIERSNPTSGESLCETMVRARSMVTSVFNSLAGGSAAVQPSSNGSRAAVSKRPCMKERAPRMWSRGFVESGGMADTVYPDSNERNERTTRRNIGLLAACQALLFTNNSTLIAINGLAGLSLAPYAALATLPVTCWVLGGALATMAASFYMKRAGRQAGLTRGTFFGIVGALICAAAILLHSFWLLCLGTLVWGVYNAFGQYYRFVAADIATPDLRANAISIVLAGGLVGGIVGPAARRPGGPTGSRSPWRAAGSGASSPPRRAAIRSISSSRSSWAPTSRSSASRSSRCCCCASFASRRRARPKERRRAGRSP